MRLPRRSLLFIEFGPAALVLIAWAMAVSARLYLNGSSFGLNYSVYQPDGQDFFVLSEFMLGRVSAAAVPADLWARPAYSLVSLPFVSFMGRPGMLVVPILALLGVGLVMLSIGRRWGNSWTAAGLFTLLTVSPTVMRWMVADLSDPLHALIFSLALLVIAARANPLWLLPLVLLADLTRPSELIWLSLFLVLGIRSEAGVRWPFFLGAFLSCASAFMKLALVPDVSGSVDGYVPTLEERVTSLLHGVIKVPVVEFAELAVLDRLLLAVVAVATWAAFRTLEHESSRLHLVVLTSALFMGAWNGALGVNFRFQLPAVITSCWVILQVLPGWAEGWSLAHPNRAETTV